MQKNKAFPRSKGKIKKILMGAAEAGDVQHFGRIAGLMQQLGDDDAGLVVWCNSTAIREELKTFIEKTVAHACPVACRNLGELLPATARCLLISPKNGHENYSRWVRDAFVFDTIQPCGTVRMAKTGIPKHSDHDWAETHLAALCFDDGTHFSLQNTVVPVAGGNILGDDDGNFLLVGANQIRFVEPQTRLDFVSEIRLVEIGKHTTTPPHRLAHIDLYLTMTGCAVRQPLRPLLLVARCELVSAKSQPDLLPQVERLNFYLDEVTAALESNGFAVLRNLVPMLKNEQNGAFYLCALNNCLVETTPDRRTVWLANITQGQENSPYFSKLRQAEMDNAAIWQQLGFEVRWVAGDFHDLLDEDGGLHCVTNEFREPAPTDPILIHF